MADPSAYLTRLLWLKKQIVEGNRLLDEMSERMRLLSILFSIQDTIRFFNEEIVKAQEGIRLHIDEGVKYEEWTNPNWIVGYDWMISGNEVVDDQLSQAWNANSESLLNESEANNMSAYLPKSVRASFSESVGRNTFSQAMKSLSGPYFNTENLKVAIYQAAKSLASTLSELKDTLARERTPQEYKGMVSGLWLAYNMENHAVSITQQYNADKQDCSEDITQEWLMNRRDEALSIFKQSSFVAAKMRDTNNDADRAVNRLCTVAGDITFDKDAEAGKFIYKRHMNRQQINDYFAFRKRVELIQDDMLSLRTQEQDIFPPEMDFTHTVFNDNRDARRIFNKLYQLVANDNLLTAKKQWYVIYIVFKDKNWLKKTAGTSFCSDIQNIFASTFDDDIWKPSAEDFRKIDDYYKNHSYKQWSKDHADAPSTCENYKRIADTINTIFDRTFLR